MLKSHARFIFSIMISVFCIALSGCTKGGVSYAQFKSKPKGTVRVATYNINWGSDAIGKVSKPPLKTLAAIVASQADIILLQETTQRWKEVLTQHLIKTYRFRQFLGGEDSGGIAVLSHYPIHRVRLLKPPVGWFPGLIVEVATPQGDVQILNVHLTPPLVTLHSMGFMGIGLFKTPPIRYHEMEYLFAHLNPHMKTLIAGDFNEDTRGFVSGFLRRHGAVDALWCDPQQSTTWHWRWLVLKLSRRLDHMFTAPDMQPLQVQVLREGESDHYPLIADYRIR